MELSCKDCGKVFFFDADDSLMKEDSPLAESYRELLKNLRCDSCADARDAAKKKQQEAVNLAILADTINDRMDITGIPENFRRLEMAYCRELAVELWKIKDSHIVITGETGCGKTSSMALVVRKMMYSKEIAVKYYTLSSFIAAVNRAKKADYGEEGFWQSVKKLDYLIVDEIAGRRGVEKLSPAGQDCFFTLLDMAYTQNRPHVWLAGNIYAGSMENLFDDPAPAIRRLAVFRKLTGQITDKEKGK